MRIVHTFKVQAGEQSLDRVLEFFPVRGHSVARHPLARSGSTRAGFTLLEILLALAVSGIVLSVVTTVYFGALQLRNRTAQTFDEALPLQQSLMVIKRDLTALLPPGGTLSGELQSKPTVEATSAMNLFANGQQVSPLFYTATGIVDEYTPFADVQKVAYYLVEPTNTISSGRDLVRVVSGNLLPATVDEPVSRWLMGGVQAMYFQYFDGTTWMTTWDSTTSSNLPAAIKVQLTLATDETRPNYYLQDPVEIVVPILSQPATVESTGAGGDQ